MRRTTRALLFLFCVVMLCIGATRRRTATPPQSAPLDARRSFAVTDKAILDGFSFERVLTTLTAGTQTTPVQLYQQWLDTFNAKPGLVSPDGPHCDDFLVDGGASFNGFPRRCPVPEGLLANDPPFTPGRFIPIGIINRFDLAPADGSNCGQYRLIFARPSPVVSDLFHIIFEAVLPNPHPEAGLYGCRPVAAFWADLSAVGSMDERRAQLEMFFFQGLPGFSPVVRAENYSGAGGIRTSHNRTGATGLRMYQFRATRDCTAADCRITMRPDVLENMIFGTFFDSHLDTPQARRFRDNFVTQVSTLAVRDVNEYFMNVPSEYLMAESNPSDTVPLFILDSPFTIGLTTSEGTDFNNRIAAELTRIGSTLTPSQIVQRADTQTCIGCHVVSGPVGEGVVFPRPGDHLQQIDEHLLEPGEAGARFTISAAMQVFIPHRMKVMQDFLNSGKAPVHSDSGATIGGGRSVQ
ncbi:MAG TPA: hypothetical protein VNN25_27465 [Thermoanaerobaculia bacterium]|nr:hypothetical protein [Thermoanaerobaculia bacterium]